MSFARPTLFPELTASAIEAPKQLLRQRRHVCNEKMIRKVKGQCYQLRIWIGRQTHESPGPKNYNVNCFSINCGLYPNEELAIAACKALIAELGRVRGELSPLKVWEALKALIERGVVPRRVLPKWVFHVKGRFGAKVKLRGLRITTKLYNTPEQAHKALASRLGEVLGVDREEKTVRDLEYHFRRDKIHRSKEKA